MGANNKDTVILKANKDFYDNLNQNQRSNFDLMAVNLSGQDYELDTLHQELKQREDALGKPYFKAKKQRVKRENEIREQKIKQSKK